MWHAFGNFQSDNFLKYKIKTGTGQSGSPIIKRAGGNEFIIGIHIGKDRDYKWNIAVQLTPQKRKLINEWVVKIIGNLYLGKFGLIQLVNV